MIGQTHLILLDLAVLALELDYLVDEDLLVREAKQVVAVELKLGRDVEGSLDQLERVCEQFYGQLVLLLQNDAVLRVANVEPDGEREPFQIDVHFHLCRVVHLVSAYKIVLNNLGEVEWCGVIVFIIVLLFEHYSSLCTALGIFCWGSFFVFPTRDCRG